MVSEDHKSGQARLRSLLSSQRGDIEVLADCVLWITESSFKLTEFSRIGYGCRTEILIFLLSAGDYSQLLVSSVQWLNQVQLFKTSWTATLQASMSITSSQSLLKLRSIESVMPSNHLILCYPLLLPPSTFPNIRVFSMSQFFASGGQSIMFVPQNIPKVIFKSLFYKWGNRLKKFRDSVKVMRYRARA